VASTNWKLRLFQMSLDRQTNNSFLFYMANERTWWSSGELTIGQSLCSWAQFGGVRRRRVPPLFHFRFCIWTGFKNKSDVCHVLCEELFILDGRLHIARFMLKQSLEWYHWFCSFIKFRFDKIACSLFQVFRGSKKWLTATVRHFTLCGMLLERLVSCKSESFTAAHVREHSTAMFCSVQKCYWLYCNVVYHVFSNRQCII